MLSRMDDPIYSVMVIWMYSFFFFSNIHQSMVNFAIFSVRMEIGIEMILYYLRIFIFILFWVWCLDLCFKIFHCGWARFYRPFITDTLGTQWENSKFKGSLVGQWDSVSKYQVKRGLVMWFRDRALISMHLKT